MKNCFLVINYSLKIVDIKDNQIYIQNVNFQEIKRNQKTTVSLKYNFLERKNQININLKYQTAYDYINVICRSNQWQMFKKKI